MLNRNIIDLHKNLESFESIFMGRILWCSTVNMEHFAVVTPFQIGIAPCILVMDKTLLTMNAMKWSEHKKLPNRF